MPQLNPSPWFITLVLAWLVLLVLAMPKTMTFLFPNGPDSHSAKVSSKTPWAWHWP